MRGEKKRLTWIDIFAKHGWYTKNSCRRQKKEDKKRSNRWFRRYNRNICNREERKDNDE